MPIDQEFSSVKAKEMKLGIDLGGTKIEIVVLDDSGSELLRQRLPTPKGDYAGTLQAIKKLVNVADSALKTNNLPIGIGTPGITSPNTGLIKNSNSICLIGKPLKRDLEVLLKREVRLANDANCFALSEAVDGAGKGHRTVFGAILGTGVGGGLVINGQVLTGANGIAGEWGHNPLPWIEINEINSPNCYCGRRNCIETFLSGPALEFQYFSASRIKKTADEIAKDHSPLAQELISTYEVRLAKSLASIINVFDPDVIVLGGGLSNIESLYTRVPEIWGQWIFSDTVETKLLPAKFGDSSGVRGAAWLF